jgi:hypothetical protein
MKLWDEHCLENQCSASNSKGLRNFLNVRVGRPWNLPSQIEGRCASSILPLHWNALRTVTCFAVGAAAKFPPTHLSFDGTFCHIRVFLQRFVYTIWCHLHLLACTCKPHKSSLHLLLNSRPSRLSHPTQWMLLLSTALWLDRALLGASHSEALLLRNVLRSASQSHLLQTLASSAQSASPSRSKTTSGECMANFYAHTQLLLEPMLVLMAR